MATSKVSQCTPNHVCGSHTRHDNQTTTCVCRRIWGRQHSLLAQLVTAPLHPLDHVQRCLHTVWAGPPSVFQTPWVGAPCSAAASAFTTAVSPVIFNSSVSCSSDSAVPPAPYFPGCQSYDQVSARMPPKHRAAAWQFNLVANSILAPVVSCNIAKILYLAHSPTYTV